MNILMMTNSYTPLVGGVPRSVAAFAAAYRARGHRVLIVAPESDNAPPNETDVLRIPAIQHFNGSDFAVVLPVPFILDDELSAFQPEIVHSHHPFLLGATALRVARFRQIPLVFTHHTLYEHYTHYVPGNSPALRRFAIDLATHYANLCDQVFAPSQSVAALIRSRGVTTPIAVVPTGVDTQRFAHGDRHRWRKKLGIPAHAFVVGHLGRLAAEKNLRFLTESVSQFLQTTPQGYFFVVGSGHYVQAMERLCSQAGVADRLRLVGNLEPAEVVDAYHAMDVFVFASHSETQGMVLTEAMAAGIPVIALNAPGVREVVVDGVNGRLLPEENLDAFTKAIRDCAGMKAEQYTAWVNEARNQANAFSIERTADQAIDHYARLIARKAPLLQPSDDLWSTTRRLIEAEWNMLKGVASAASTAIVEPPDSPVDSP